MKRLCASLLGLALCIVTALPASAASQPVLPDPESPDEQLMERISHMTLDELNDYLIDLHLLELAQSERFQEWVPFPEDTDEALLEALSDMTMEELNGYLHRLYLLCASPDYEENQAVKTDAIRAAWLIAAQAAKLAGYPCAGTIVEASALGNDYVESNGLLANTIQTTSAYSAWLSTGGTSIEFTKSDCADLFYALHLASIHVTGSPSHVLVRITDVFDFVFETDMEDLFSTLVNDWAWLSQTMGALSPINIQVDIYQ